MKKHEFHKFALVFVAIGFLESCGAPLKTADKVEDIFIESEDLAQKMATLCGELRGSQQAPNLAGIQLIEESCTTPGNSYLNLNNLVTSSKVDFSSENWTSVPSENSPDGSGDLFQLATRSEIYLNRSVLQFASKVFDKVKQASNDPNSTNENSIGREKNIKVSIIDKPVFDSETLVFSLRVHVISSKSANGIVDIDNIITVQGRVVEKQFIAISLIADPGLVDKSIVKSMKILGLLIPHAGDIYLDLTSNFEYFSFGIDPAFRNSARELVRKSLFNLPAYVASVDSTN